MYLYDKNIGLLDQEKIAVLYERIKSEDKSALNQLIEGHLYFVISIAKRYAREDLDVRDLINTGCIGLIKAVLTYDISKGFSFITYAGECIKNEIKMYLNKERKHKVVVLAEGYNVLNSDGQVEFLPLEDLVCTPTDELYDNYFFKERKQALKKLRDIVTGFNVKPRRIISMSFGLDGKVRSQQDIGKELNICQPRVSRIKYKALDKLRSHPMVQRIHDDY